MKKIKIDGKEYTFEFTIEASLCDECVGNIMELFAKMGEAKNGKSVKKMIESMANVPKAAMSMFYAGLLEHHGEDGDGSILEKKDAKDLLRKFFDEHKEDGNGNFYTVMTEMLECMSDDGFFGRIGLDKLFETKQTEKVVKDPQDHKKKATKATEK